MKHIFIIGSKGIPARYGGFETFVDRLTLYKKSEEIQYYVACLDEQDKEEFEYHGAICFTVKVPKIGPARAVVYDILAFLKAISIIKDKKLSDPVIYILACRIGPFIKYLKKTLLKYNGTLYINPDGHEWMRDKWNFLIKKYWKFSERLMMKYADRIVCDSKNIEKYILAEYKSYSLQTQFIPYGAEKGTIYTDKDNTKIEKWFKEKEIEPEKYYLIVGRFVPENNYHTIIKEFLKTNIKKKLVIITDVKNNKFYHTILKETTFTQDSRIQFAGTVYDSQILQAIRERAYGYIHGHEVGGTNPSLLEAMQLTKVNLLLKVPFNQEVGQNGAYYWTKDSGNLENLLENLERLTVVEREQMEMKAKDIIRKEYSWDKVVKDYETLFLS